MKRTANRPKGRKGQRSIWRRFLSLTLFVTVSVGIGLGASTFLAGLVLPGRPRPLAFLSQLYLQSNQPPPTLHFTTPERSPSFTPAAIDTGSDLELAGIQSAGETQVSPTVTATPSSTATSTVSPSITMTPTITRTGTLPPTLTRTRTRTPYPTWTRTRTPIPTATRTPTLTFTPTMTPTLTPGSPPPPTATFTQTSTPTLSPIPPTETQTAGCNVTANSGFESTLLGLINAERQDRGLHTYALQGQLQAAARVHSEDMACNDFLDHTGSDGSGVRDRVERQGYSWSWIGENIYATGNTSSSAPQQAFNWWMNSELHRNNLLHQRYTEIGIGYRHSPDSSYGGYFTAVFARP